MLYFREEELIILKRFRESKKKKALAVYGRRRVGKTELILHFMKTQPTDEIIYFQCAGYDYNNNLYDFQNVLKDYLKGDMIIGDLPDFKETIFYFGRNIKKNHIIVIDEFPFLCRKKEEVAAEFQWIIDHGLEGTKLILLGSNRSFMKRQINDREAPLYGRFDDIIEVAPFTFGEVHQLFPEFEQAVDVYAQTGGVAQYVMMFKDYKSVHAATDDLFFYRNGRLLQEADNLLMQELRDVTTYVSILRALSGGEKDSGQIARGAGMDVRSVFSYLVRLSELNIVTTVENCLQKKKHDKRFAIVDPLFRFHYAFIEPNISMITALGKKARPLILNERYSEYLGSIYEDIIRSNSYAYALSGILPFMPDVVGKWWGNVMREGEWAESEVDLVAYNRDCIVIGECKYKKKKTGKKELEALRAKAQFIPSKGRKVYYLLASRSGFTEELRGEDVILIERI